MKKRLVLCLSLLVLLLAGCGNNASNESSDKTPTVNSNAEATINLNDYVSHEISGTSGNSGIHIQLNTEEIAADCNRYLNGIYTVHDVKVALEGGLNHSIQTFVISSVDDDGTLTNGDTVTYSWTVNERGLRLLSDMVNAKFVYEDIEITIKGLEDAVIEINPFTDSEHFMVWCDNDGSWEISLLDRRSGGSSWYGVEFEVDTMGKDATELKNGDQVKITILTSDEDLENKYGYRLTTKTGVVTVDWED